MFALAVALSWVGVSTALVAGTALLMLIALQIVWQDMLTLTIADGASLALAIVGVTLRLQAGLGIGFPLKDEIVVIAIEAGATFAVLFGLREYWYRRRGFDGLGLGDVKLAAAGAATLGAPALSAALLMASLAGLATFGALRLWRGPAALSSKLAFGALLAPAIVAVEIVISRSGWLGPLAGPEWQP
ncbi:prepilin peptidase [Oryzibacter oryziterrae]|uniref:prepilin peptidase n=1 Tax=Oryzibacter oryziterrae TaxID=2766474 RepID=UPI001F031638|nr:prepilin peptidase [Oryzibacter oryziterrae]